MSVDWSRGTQALGRGKVVPLLTAGSYVLGGAAGAMFELNWFATGSVVLVAGAVVLWVLEARGASRGAELLGAVLADHTVGLHAPVAPHFTGRRDEIDRVREALTTSGSATLQGLGGVGKTQVAAEYARRFSDDYDLVWWVRAHDSAALAFDFDSLAVARSLADDPEQRRHAVVTWLHKHDRWLLVFDNATAAAQVQRFLPVRERGHVLVTTRERLELTRSVVEVADWSDDDAAAFVRSVLGDVPEDAARALVGTLHNVPLAVAQAVNHIALSGMSIEDYLSILKVRAGKLLAAGRAFDRTDTVASTWSLSIDAANRESRGAEKLLRLCSFYSAGPMPRNLPRITGSMKMKTGLGLPSPIAARFRRQLRDDVTYHGWVAALSRHMLISTTGSTLQVHPLVAQVVRADMRKSKARLLLDMALIGLLEATERQDLWRSEGSAETLKALLPHVRSLGGFADDTAPPITALTAYKVRVAWYIWRDASLLLSLAAHRLVEHDPDEGDRAARLSLRLAEKAHAPSMAFRGAGAPYSWLAMANALEVCGLYALRRSDLDNAEALLTRGLTVTAARVSPFQRAGIVTGLMLVHHHGGDPDGALALFEREWPALDRHLPHNVHERDMLIAVRDDIAAESTAAPQEEPSPGAPPPGPAQ